MRRVLAGTGSAALLVALVHAAPQWVLVVAVLLTGSLLLVFMCGVVLPAARESDKERQRAAHSVLKTILVWTVDLVKAFRRQDGS
ncbi:hypothetical protein [Nonomuraea jabiensis]|uniref:hypothetical protein n=1 Tax=Nonomuraea jabiensis TaxID=882448 RepID=UPI003D733D40